MADVIADRRIALTVGGTPVEETSEYAATLLVGAGCVIDTDVLAYYEITVVDDVLVLPEVEPDLTPPEVELPITPPPYEIFRVAGGVPGAIDFPGSLINPMIQPTDKLVAVLARRLPVVMQTTVAGAGVGDIAVTGMTEGSSLVSVINYTDGTDVTSHFTAGVDEIAGDESTEGKKLLVTWEIPEALSDLTSEFEPGFNEIVNDAESGTDTTGHELLVFWKVGG